MLNRLIIAVFGLSLVFALGSNAQAGPGDLTSFENEPARFIPNHPKLNEGIDIRPVQPSFKKPASARIVVPDVTGASLPSQLYFCDFQGYAISGPAFVWDIPDPYGDDLMNQRFTVEDNFECTLKVAHFLMYAPNTVGTPDMRVYLWDDDGFGFPGSLLDSVDIPFATLAAEWAATAPSPFAFMSADFSAAGWVFADGDEYHYGWTPIGGPGEGLSLVSDQGGGPSAGEERSSEFYLGAWGSMLNDWGVDVAFHILSERCCEEIPFSDCYTQSYWTNVARIYRAPQPTYGDTSYTQRFSVEGPETLQSVDLYIYDRDDGEFGNDDVYVTIYDDDGFGQPGTQLAQVTLPAGTYPSFPSASNAVFGSLVLEGDFHVGFSSSGVPGVNWEWILSDDGLSGTARSNASGDPTWPGGTTWYSMLAWWGRDVNFLIEANLCRDEFSECSITNYFVNFTTVYPVPDGNPVIEWAQRFTALGGAECDLREISLCFYRHPSFDGPRPGMYTKNTAIRIYENDGGFPGAVLHTTILTPADYAAAGYTGPDFFGAFLLTITGLNVIIPPSYFVGYEALTGTRDSGIRVCIDNQGGEGQPVGGLVINAPPFGGWLPSSAFAFIVEDASLFLGTKVCCVPFPGATCLPPDTWTTQSHDFGRTGASNMSIDDAWCDLTTSWLYETPANTIPYMSPIVHDGRVYISTATSAGNASTVEVLDLITGANLYTISDPDFGNFIFNDPTIVGSILYISGGDTKRITAWDISTTPATKVMSRLFGGAVGPLRFANTIVLDIGGTDVVYAASQVGRVVAIDAVTGADYGGWAGPNPVTLISGQRILGSATDGASLFYGTDIAGLDGDVFAVDAATGAINWQLSTSGGLQGANVYGASDNAQREGFTNISYDAGKLFVGARMYGDAPRDGVFYVLDANTGAVVNAIKSNAFEFSNPIVDINLVYLQTHSRRTAGTSSAGNSFFAVSKKSGGVAWQSETIYNSLSRGRFNGQGVRSCEPEDGPYPTDIIINTDTEGSISFWNSLTGEQLFRRRWDYGQDVSAGASVTLAADVTGAVHVLVTNLNGAVVDLVKGADRPRLEIQSYSLELPVNFSVVTSDIKTISNALVNTGCADLTFTNVSISDVSNGSSDPYIVSIDVVRQELLDRSADLASRLAAAGSFFKYLPELNTVDEGSEFSLTSVRELARNNERFISRAATSAHPYLNGVTSPVNGQVLAGGDSLDIILDVNPAEILRGPQIFYIGLETDDPDFYVNAGSAFLPSAFPEIKVTLVGGCLLDTTYMEFGAVPNIQVVTNTGRLGTGEDPLPGFDIDGESTIYYQGTYVFGVSAERIAMSTQDWSGGGGEVEAWKSIQADPNWCDNTCKPALLTNLTLGSMWDGAMAMYVPITGNMVCVSWIDSVQNFDLGDGTGWNWRNYSAGFDDALTMGVSANTRTFGATNVPALANLTVEIFDITERNGNSIPDWKFGSFHDYDIVFVLTGVEDTSLVDQSISTAWCTDANLSSDVAWGQIKVPFGCGYTPLKNAYAIDETQGQFSTAASGRGNPYWDSAYHYMSLPAGNHGHFVTGTPDQAQHFTLVEHDFGPNETISFGIANFGFNSGLATVANGSALAPTAHLVNKWVGFGRGDVDDDNVIGLADIMTLVGIVSGSVPGAIPFEHLADVNADGAVDVADINYLFDYYFNGGPCPAGAWTL